MSLPTRFEIRSALIELFKRLPADFKEKIYEMGIGANQVFGFIYPPITQTPVARILYNDEHEELVIACVQMDLDEEDRKEIAFSLQPVIAAVKAYNLDNHDACGNYSYDIILDSINKALK